MNANCLSIFIDTCLTYSILIQSTSSIYLRSLSQPRNRNRLLLRGSRRAGVWSHHFADIYMFTGCWLSLGLVVTWNLTYDCLGLLSELKKGNTLASGNILSILVPKVVNCLICKTSLPGFWLRLWSLLMDVWTNWCLSSWSIYKCMLTGAVGFNIHPTLEFIFSLRIPLAFQLSFLSTQQEQRLSHKGADVIKPDDVAHKGNQPFMKAGHQRPFWTMRISKPS